MLDFQENAAGLTVARSAESKLAFHGAAPVARRAGSAQAAVPTTALTAGATYSQAEVEAIIARVGAIAVLVNELRAALVEKGIIKGSA